MGSLRVGHNWATSLSLFTFTHWRRKWQPTPVFLPGESQGQGSLVGCRLWGPQSRTRLKRLSSSSSSRSLEPHLQGWENPNLCHRGHLILIRAPHILQHEFLQCLRAHGPQGRGHTASFSFSFSGDRRKAFLAEDSLSINLLLVLLKISV